MTPIPDHARPMELTAECQQIVTKCNLESDEHVLFATKITENNNNKSYFGRGRLCRLLSMCCKRTDEWIPHASSHTDDELSRTTYIVTNYHAIKYVEPTNGWEETKESAQKKERRVKKVPLDAIVSVQVQDRLKTAYFDVIPAVILQLRRTPAPNKNNDTAFQVWSIPEPTALHHAIESARRAREDDEETKNLELPPQQQGTMPSPTPSSSPSSPSSMKKPSVTAKCNDNELEKAVSMKRPATVNRRDNELEKAVSVKKSVITVNRRDSELEKAVSMKIPVTVNRRHNELEKAVSVKKSVITVNRRDSELEKAVPMKRPVTVNRRDSELEKAVSVKKPGITVMCEKGRMEPINNRLDKENVKKEEGTKAGKEETSSRSTDESDDKDEIPSNASPRAYKVRAQTDDDLEKMMEDVQKEGEKNR